MPEMNCKALQALTRAWVTTVIATLLLSAALAIAPVWDSPAYLDGAARRGEPRPVIADAAIAAPPSPASGPPVHARRAISAKPSRGRRGRKPARSP